MPRIDAKVQAATALVPGKPAAVTASRPIDPSRPSDPPRRADPWQEGLERLVGIADDRAEEAHSETRSLWTLRASVLNWLAAPDPETAARIRTAITTLEDQLPFEITALQLCRKVKGFGDYDPIEPAACRPGHAVIVYCEMTGMRYASDGPSFRSRLESRVEIRAAGGGAPVWGGVLGTADDVCRRRRRDFYVNYRVTIPESIAPGSYELRLIEDDLVGGQSASRSVALVVAP
jgi:hypothetical protein